MLPEDKFNFVSLMTNIAELYKEKLSVARLEIYWRCLQNYPIEMLRKALDAHALHPDQGQFMPKPADVVRLLEGNHATRALSAFVKVRQAIQQVGAYSSIVFDDPIIHVVINEMGGWIRLCLSTETELSFKAKEFERLYSRYIHQKPKQYPKLLSGIFHEDKLQKGYLLCKPVLFGNTVAALKVYRQEVQNINLLINHIEEN